MSDQIYRQAAIDTLADMHCKSDEDGYVWIIRSDAWARLDALPSAQPERTGKWIGYNTEQDGWKRTDGSPVFMSCSECNGLVLNNGSAHWKFCPNCGARMEDSNVAD